MGFQGRELLADYSSKVKSILRFLTMSLKNEYSKIRYDAIVEELDDLEPDSSSHYSAKAHTFEDPTVADYYRKLYESTEYEGRHHFDPEFTWEHEEERELIRKTDYKVTLLAFILFVSLDIDRGNLSNALSNNMLDDLNLTTDDMNLGSVINLLSFLSVELPSQVLSKRYGPNISIPVQICLFSIVGISQAFLTGKTGFFITRSLLGLLQGSFIPNICLWMSYFFSGKELPTRLSYFYIANPFTSAFSSLIAYFILHLDGVCGISGWRYIFAIEGAFTLGIGLWAFTQMVSSPVHTKTWFNPKGWYTYRQEKIMVNRILRDDPSKGDMNCHEALSFGHLKKSLADYDIWPIYLVRFLSDINVKPIARYLSLTLRELGFTTLTTNLLLIPSSLAGIVTMLAVAYLSEGINQRGLVIMLGPLWCLPCLFLLRYWPAAMIETWPTYFIMITALAHPVGTVLTVTWCSSNASSVSTRAVSAAVVNMFSQSAGIFAAPIYRSDDYPLYKRGNSTLIVYNILAVVVCIAAKLYYMARNRHKERLWNAMSLEQQQEYLKTTQDRGNKRLDFRFVH
ncbi:hypothetical protein AWJ20_1899 [Sugiyamaella lignohabitans]|uniref:Uncharacterized protein n=1 Tax=Sugiyamaella lignohabitans TaxID=796027 RepID=A0A167E3Q6_9ASCO|nr:uncharacterized protein AWJ20_1899 [Sugiyamaella lignohabitans]ANB13602.1 hypothetical protein AWJ20_1899 [Sugiyamaella lignohabitans]